MHDTWHAASVSSSLIFPLPGPLPPSSPSGSVFLANCTQRECVYPHRGARLRHLPITGGRSAACRRSARFRLADVANARASKAALSRSRRYARRVYDYARQLPPPHHRHHYHHDDHRAAATPYGHESGVTDVVLSRHRLKRSDARTTFRNVARHTPLRSERL